MTGTHNAVVFAFSRKGVLKGERLLEFLECEGFEGVGYTMGEYAQESDRFVSVCPDFKTAVRNEFERYSPRDILDCKLIVFIGALGIAVRAVAPFVRDKIKDPAVVCMDDAGKFVISVLSGHIGGANRFTEKISRLFGATAVITTATDISGVFSADQWAVEQGLVIANAEQIKGVSKALLNGECVGLYTDYQITGDLPKGIIEDNQLPADGCRVGMAISLNKKMKAFDHTLNLLPRIVHLGIGCRKGTACADIDNAVRNAFEENGMDVRCICCVASIDLKENETGLLSFAERYRFPVSFYTADELAKAEGQFSESDFVKSVTSVDNVCERAAVVSSGGGRLILMKTVKNGVTVAAAQADWKVCFEESEEE